jgi:hypothetical protein
MRKLPLLLLVVAVFCATFAVYIRWFIKKYDEDSSDPRRIEQIRFYRTSGLAKQMLTGAMLMSLIALVDLMFP